MLLTTVREEYVFNCQCRKLSEKTIGNYSKQLGYLFNYLEEKEQIKDIEGVVPQHIKQFLMKMRQAGRTVNSYNDLLKAFKVFFRYACEEGYTDTLLTEKIKNAKGSKVIIRTFADQELKRLITYYQGNDYLTIRNKVIMLFLVDTGVRLSELTGLTEAQIKQEHIIIKGKGDKERVVPKSPLLRKWLIKFLSVRGSYFQYRFIPDNIFLSKNAKPLTSAMIDRIVKDAGKGSDVTKDIRVSAHTFRHTYAQYQLKSGLDIYSLSRLLGHENISITQTYLNSMKDTEILQQAQRTSPLMNL
jgi:integrase/recombinase XerD